jgi:hypothetical protein
VAPHRCRQPTKIHFPAALGLTVTHHMGHSVSSSVSSTYRTLGRVGEFIDKCSSKHSNRARLQFTSSFAGEAHGSLAIQNQVDAPLIAAQPCLEAFSTCTLPTVASYTASFLESHDLVSALWGDLLSGFQRLHSYSGKYTEPEGLFIDLSLIGSSKDRRSDR